MGSGTRLRHMRVTDRDGERIGSVRSGNLNPRKLKSDHVGNLFLGRVSYAYDGLFDGIRRVFPDINTSLRRDKHSYPARLTQFQRPRPVTVDECLFDGRCVGRIRLPYVTEFLEQACKARPQIATRRPADTVRHMR